MPLYPDFAGLTDVSFSGEAIGDLVVRGASKWNNLAVPMAGGSYYLSTLGNGALPTWEPTASLGGVAIGDSPTWTGTHTFSQSTTYFGASAVAATLRAVAPTQSTAGIAGNALSFRASDATAGSLTAGAVAGGAINWTAGDAKRLTSGNANGGDLRVVPGAGIGTGTAGNFIVQQTGGTPGTNELHLVQNTNGSWFRDLSGTRLNITSGGAITLGVNYAAPTSTGWVYLSGAQVRINSSIALGWASSTDPLNGAWDAGWYRDAANTVAQRNSTNAQVYRLYYSYTDASNYTRLAFKTATGIHTLEAESAGTGEANIDLALTPKGTGRVRFGSHSAITTETLSGYIEIKDSGGITRKVAIVS